MNRVLTFRLAGEDYGIGIPDVHEIIRPAPITRVPRAAPAVRGVINLRGSVIPVLDLKRQFELPRGMNESCIIVIRVRNIQLGLIVDEVSDVVDVNDQDIEPPPPFQNGERGDCVSGVFAANGRICQLLDANRVVSYAATDRAADRQLADRQLTVR